MTHSAPSFSLSLERKKKKSTNLKSFGSGWVLKGIRNLLAEQPHHGRWLGTRRSFKVPSNPSYSMMLSLGEVKAENDRTKGPAPPEADIEMCVQKSIFDSKTH